VVADLVLIRGPVYGEGLIVLLGPRLAQPAGSQHESPEVPDGHHEVQRCPALAARGYKAIDAGGGWCEPLPYGRQRWREDAIGQLLATEDAGLQFVAGCEENPIRFHPRFDLVECLVTEHRLGRGAAR
jgi:hypothetical protein